METTKDYFHEAKYTDQNGVIQSTRVPVVQELARKGLNHLPERFITMPPDQPITPAPSLTNHAQQIGLQIIDVHKLREGQGDELAKLASCVKEWGMFLIKNHGINDLVLHGVEDVVKGFFGLSFEEKKACVGSYMSTDNIGYGRNFVKTEDQRLDWIDRLSMVAAPVADDQPLLVWPQNPPNFRQVMEKYVDEVRKVCDHLLEALAETQSLQRHAFSQQFEPNKSELKLRINCYPPCPRPDLALGISPHCDASGLTILNQVEGNEGLQVFKDLKWMTMPWPRDTLLVNIGDFMEIISNGRFISPWHRAITQRNAERISVVVFYNPPPDAEIEPVCDDGEGGCCERRYKKVVVKDYVQHYYKISPTPTKQAIKFAMV